VKTCDANREQMNELIRNLPHRRVLIVVDPHKKSDWVFLPAHGITIRQTIEILLGKYEIEDEVEEYFDLFLKGSGIFTM